MNPHQGAEFSAPGWVIIGLIVEHRCSQNGCNSPDRFSYLLDKSNRVFEFYWIQRQYNDPSSSSCICSSLMRWSVYE
jgi:hypothetical protein